MYCHFPKDVLTFFQNEPSFLRIGEKTPLFVYRSLRSGTRTQGGEAGSACKAHYIFETQKLCEQKLPLL